MNETTFLLSGTWEKAAFLKIAGLGALCLLPTSKGKYLLQYEKDRDILRPPGGHKEHFDDNLYETIKRELNEEFSIKPEDVEKKIKFLGYEYRKKYKGNALYLFKDHNLTPGIYQASNSPEEKIHLVEATLDDPKYTGPKLDKLLSEAANEEFKKKAKDQALNGDLDKLISKEESDALKKEASTKPTKFVHYSRDKYDELRPLTYDELIKDRTSGRWEKHPEKAKQYVEERKVTEQAYRNRLRKLGYPIDDNTSFLYATVPGKEQYGLNRNDSHRHEFEVSPDELKRVLFDIVGLPDELLPPEPVIGAAGLKQMQDIWDKNQDKLQTGEYMGMKIRPRIEAIFPDKYKVKADEFEIPNLKAAVHARVIYSAREGTCPHCHASEHMETSIKKNGDICCGACGKSSASPEWGVSKVAADKVLEAPALNGDQEAAEPSVSDLADSSPTTGPEAIEFALKNIDLDEKEAEAHSIIKRKLKSKRPDAVKILGIIDGLKKNNMHPSQLMISRVPVIPPQFRPYTVAGDTFVPGDSNELLRDMINVIGVHKDLVKKLGSGANKNRLHVMDAVGAVYGFHEPTSPKTRERGVSGFLQKLVGSSPKWSYGQRRLISKNQDFVGRSVIGVDPDLGLDEISLPEEMLWKVFSPLIQRHLVRHGMKPGDAVRMIKDRHVLASRAMDDVIKDHPVVYQRSPAWHKYNVIAGYPKRIKGNTILINPLVTTGVSGDFDGDCCRGWTRIKIVSTWNSKLQIFEAVEKLTDSNMQNEKTKVRCDDKFINLANFPRVEESKKQIAKNTVEYDVPPGVHVYALDRDTRQHTWMPATKFSIHENLDLWEISTRRGRSIFTSADHSLVVYQSGKLNLIEPKNCVGLCAPRIFGFERRFSIKTHHKIVGTSFSKIMEFDVPLNYDTGLWLGLLIGDGWATKTGYQVGLSCPGSKEIVGDIFSKIAQSDNLPYRGSVVAEFRPTTKFGSSELKGNGEKSKKITISGQGWFSKQLRLQIGCGALNKRIPDFCFQGSDDHLRGLFDGLMSSDGSIGLSQMHDRKKLDVSYSTSSPDLAVGVQILCERLGIRTSVTTRKFRKKQKFGNSQNPNFKINIRHSDAAAAHAQKPFKFCHPIRNKLWQENISLINLEHICYQADPVPFPQHLYGALHVAYEERHKDERYVNGEAKYGGFYGWRRNGVWQRDTAVKELNAFKTNGVWTEEFQAFEKLVKDRSIMWDLLTSATAVPGKQVGYDLTVPGAFTFALDDGLIVQDTMNVHVPMSPDAIHDAKHKLMPSKMLWSIKDPTKVVPVPKQENVLGLYQAQHRPAKNKHVFPDEASALAAIKAGKVRLSDEVEIQNIKK